MAKVRRNKSREFDSAWKEVIEEHFESFIEFFYPDVYRDIDFAKPVEILRLQD